MGFRLGFLTFATLGFGLIVPYLSIRGIQKLRESDAPKSSLSRDGIQERLEAVGVRKR